MSKAKGANGTTANTNASPFAALEAMRASLPQGEPEKTAATPATKPQKTGPTRAVVRMERKGRRGKEATIIEKLGLSAEQLEVWCRELKQALGCGGSVEGDAILLQGDLRQRLPAVLEARGVGRVTVG